MAVLGATVARLMFQPGDDSVGRYLLIKNVPFQIIGVLGEKGATTWGGDQSQVQRQLERKSAPAAVPGDRRVRCTSTVLAIRTGRAHARAARARCKRTHDA